jgi:hypothetical protein
MKTKIFTIISFTLLTVYNFQIKAQIGAAYDAPNNQFKITTNFGNLIMGPSGTVSNYGWCHMKTDASMFFFDKPLVSATGIFGAYNTTNLVFQTNANPNISAGYNVTRMTILNSNGNIGVGTTTPDKILTVKSITANTQIAKFADNAKYIGLGRDEVAAFDLTGNLANLYLGGSKFNILTNGNIGIATTTPDKILTVKSTTANTQIAKFADDMRYIGIGRDEVAAFDLAGNPANLYLGGAGKLTILTTGNIGLGTTNPSEHFQVGDRFVFHDGASKYLGYNTHFDGTNNVRLVNDYSSAIGFGGGDINFQTAAAGIPGSIINATSKLIIKNTGEIGIGTNTPNKKLTVIGDASIVSSNANAFEILDANSIVNFRVKNTGVVYAREINVQLTAFPDYVFKKDYVLTPLLEVEKYIIKNNHLKGFEPAKEYESNGMAVGEIVILQQEKIEELTLYLIEQQKQIVELKKQMDSFKK